MAYEDFVGHVMLNRVPMSNRCDCEISGWRYHAVLGWEHSLRIGLFKDYAWDVFYNGFCILDEKIEKIDTSEFEDRYSFVLHGVSVNIHVDELFICRAEITEHNGDIWQAASGTRYAMNLYLKKLLNQG